MSCRHLIGFSALLLSLSLSSPLVVAVNTGGADFCGGVTRIVGAQKTHPDPKRLPQDPQPKAAKPKTDHSDQPARTIALDLFTWSNGSPALKAFEFLGLPVPEGIPSNELKAKIPAAIERRRQEILELWASREPEDILQARFNEGALRDATKVLFDLGFIDSQNVQIP